MMPYYITEKERQEVEKKLRKSNPDFMKSVYYKMERKYGLERRQS